MGYTGLSPEKWLAEKMMMNQWIFRAFRCSIQNIWVWVNTYRYMFSGMNIHLPAILGFTRYQSFDPSPHLCLSAVNPNVMVKKNSLPVFGEFPMIACCNNDLFSPHRHHLLTASCMAPLYEGQGILGIKAQHGHQSLMQALRTM